MNNANTGRQDCDVICRNHSAKSERDLYRVCPSNLSKRELENLYFSLLENNVDLKKTVHTQQEKLKVLSTKLQRMTVVQRNAAAKEKNCCPSKVLLNEQKEMVAELKKANERMADKIRILNMRLCSAKQFLKRSPSQLVRCSRCANISGASPFKNSSVSVLNAKHSGTSVKFNSASSQYLSEDAAETTQAVKTEDHIPEKEISEKPCNENKCITAKDELKQKIVNFEQELSRTHVEYSSRISKLESEVSNAREENMQVRSRQVASEHAAQLTLRRTEELRGQLRETKGIINELTMQLTIERRKVAELETTAKLTNTSSQMVQIIERLNTFNQQKPQTATEVFQSANLSPYRCAKRGAHTETSGIELQSSSPKVNDGYSKSDDSGCADLNKSSEAEEEKVMDRINLEMLVKISDLQTQLDTLGIRAAGESTKVERRSSIDTENCKIEERTTVITIADDRAKIQGVDALDVKRTNSQTDIDVDKSTPTVDLLRKSEEKANSSKLVKDAVDDKKTDKGLNESMKFKTSAESAIQGKSQIKIDATKKDTNDDKYQIPEPKTALDKKIFKNSENGSKESKDEMRSFLENSIKNNETKGNDDTCPKSKDNITVKEITNKDFTTSDMDRMTAKNVTSNQKPKATEKKHKPLDDLTERNTLKPNSDVSNVEKSRLIDKSSSNNTDLGNRKFAKHDVATKQEMKTVSPVTKESSDLSYIHRNTDKVASAKTEKAEQKLSDVNKDECGANGAKATIRRDFVKYSASMVSVRRNSVKYNVEASELGDSLTNSAVAPARRDSATYNAEALLARRDSATYNAEAPTARRDSATYNAEATPGRRDSTTYNAEAPPGRRDSASLPKATNQAQYSRTSSPANTEHEISSLSDLPPEKDGGYPEPSPAPRSPGEAAPPLDTESTLTSTRTDYGTLSEGELPTPVRDRKLSIGEKAPYVNPGRESCNVQMEATLNAIGVELARCRQLLVTSRSQMT